MFEKYAMYFLTGTSSPSSGLAIFSLAAAAYVSNYISLNPYSEAIYLATDVFPHVPAPFTIQY